MKIRFLMIFILVMVVFLLISIIIPYQIIKEPPKNPDRDIQVLFKGLGLTDTELKQRALLYNPVYQEDRVDKARKISVLFIVEFILFGMLLLILYFGVIAPIRKLSFSVKSMYFEKRDELEIRENGVEEVRLLYRAYNEMLGRLKEYQEHIGNIEQYKGWKRISRIIVHEVNNIISPMKMNLGLMLMKIDENGIGEIQKRISAVYHQIEDVGGVLRKFREMAHLPDAQLKELDIVPVLQELVQEYESLELEIRDGLYCPILADEALLKVILRNLIKNAREAGENVLIKIRVKDINNEALIEVEDNGCGIGPDLLEQIFEPGYSTKDTSKENLGIGLSIVKSLVEEQSGKISVSSKIGTGSIFVLSFKKK